MNDTQISPRQQQILELLTQDSLSRQAIERALGTASRITIIRDLNYLLSQELIMTTGINKATVYSRLPTHPLLQPPITRNPAIDIPFNANIFDSLRDLFTSAEKSYLVSLHQDLQKTQSTLSPTLFKKELERFTIELAWKSSVIEGNTYTLLETEALLKNLQAASGKTQVETQMILNHKIAFDYIMTHRPKPQELTLAYILKIHELLTHQLNVSPHLRTHPVGITGSTYQPPKTLALIKKSLEQLLKTINQTQDPIEKSLIAVAMLSYIQPFEDGNKRTARLIGNALLLSHHYYPISYRAVSEIDYKQALLYFYEQNTLLPFKKIFLDQYEFALTHYFQI